jgi:hypothetical protein
MGAKRNDTKEVNPKYTDAPIKPIFTPDARIANTFNIKMQHMVARQNSA